MLDPVETAELLALTTIVDLGSFTRAAAALRLPRVTLSRRLARLEERLGTRLLRRTTRSLFLTEAGETFCRHARIVLAALDDAQQSLRGHEGLHGVVRVAVPVQVPPSFHAMVCAFAAAHPAVRLEIHLSNHVVDVHREGYDVALRLSGELEPGLVARTVMRDHRIAVASPDYLAKYGTPRSRRELRHHRCLMGFARGDQPQTAWTVGTSGKVHVDGCLFSNSFALLRVAALGGLGIAMLPRREVDAQLASGALVQVLPGNLECETRAAVVFPDRKLEPAQVRAFRDELIAWALAEASAMRAHAGPPPAQRKPRTGKAPRNPSRTTRRDITLPP